MWICISEVVSSHSFVPFDADSVFCESCAECECFSLAVEMTTASALYIGHAERAAPMWWTCSS